MIPEIGHFSLVLALCVALVLGIFPLWGAQRGHAAWMALARPAALAQFALLALSYVCLTYAFVTHDFSVALAANHSHTDLPLLYRLTAVWGNHEGSILLWSLIMAAWTLAVAIYSRQLDAEISARVLAVMGLVSCGFLLFTLLTSNPFERMLPAAANGKDLNPLLQDPGMAIHPPMLYMGYVGFVVPFAFAVAALLAGRLDAAWARWSRPWTTAAWSFLTVGIALGSFWAYYELGWGGWWFWDPVENASFMPWLVGTALMHSLAVTEKRGGFKMWTALLAILAFSLSLLGAFIVRSGVLSSVHAFATDPERGVFILVFLTVVVGGSLALFAWRAPQIERTTASSAFTLVSREAALLANNVLLLVACAAVLLGTLYPLLIDALGMGKLSVGPPYFDAVFVPLMAPALFLMGVGPLARWRQADAKDLALRLRWAAGVSVATAVLVAAVLQRWSPMTGLGLWLAFWVAAGTLVNLVERLRQHPAPSLPARLQAQPASYYGMLMAHMGMAVFIVGVTVVSSFQSESDVRMQVGETAEVGGYRFELQGVNLVQGPNYSAAQARLAVTKEGRAVAVLSPERRIYSVSRMAMTEVAIDRGVTRDLYVALGEPVSSTAWSVRVHHKPFVNWIWGGCALMALGGLLAVMDLRYRALRSRRAAAFVPAATGLSPAGIAAKTLAQPQPQPQPQLKSNLLRWLPLAGFAVLLVFLAVGLGLKPREVPSPLLDRPLPAFTLPTLAAPGQSLSPQDLRGQVWLLNVWASWCVACQQEHPLLVEFAKRETVPLLGLNYKDKREDALRWLGKYGDPYRASLSDSDGRVGIELGVYGVPETYVIDRQGVIRHKHIGAVTPEALQDTILPLLRKLGA